MAQQWYYARAGQKLGPVEWDDLRVLAGQGGLAPQDMVWSEGMAEWVPAGTIPGLLPPAPTPGQAVLLAYAGQPDARRQKILRNAKQNCIVLFVLFVLALSAIAYAVLAAFSASTGSHDLFLPLGCFGYLIPPAVVFAAIYLPVRWRYIMELPSSFRMLGLVGGFGLIGLVALWLVAAVILAARTP